MQPPDFAAAARISIFSYKAKRPIESSCNKVSCRMSMRLTIRITKITIYQNNGVLAKDCPYLIRNGESVRLIGGFHEYLRCMFD